MPVSTILLALSLAATPPAGPSRLDPTDIEALEALLRAMDAAEEEQEAASDQDAADEALPVNDELDDSAAPADDIGQEDAAGDDGAIDEEARDEAIVDEEAVESPAQPDAPDADLADETGDETGESPEPSEAPEASPADEMDESPASDAQAPDAEMAADDDEAAQPASPEASAMPALRRMTPHVGMDQYEAVRGTALGDGVALSWNIKVGPLDSSGAPDADTPLANGAGLRSRTFIAGNSWAAERSDSGTWLYDFEANRILTLNSASSSYSNTSIYAAVRRNVDIYAALSQGGQAEEIAFGPQTSFHRFWLEAAMSVAAAPADLTQTTRPAEAHDGATGDGTVTSWYREEGGSPVASAWTGCEGVELSPARHRNLITAFAHRVAIHPDIVAALRDGGEPLCALSFAVISPESPQGRVEHWRLDSTESMAFAALGFEDASLGSGNQDLIDAELRAAIASALSGELGDPPSPPDFMVEIQGLQREDDFAGALLTLTQETTHFDLCPAETIGSERLACAGAERLAAAGVGNAGFEAISEATQAAGEGAHRLAVERLLPYLDRDGHAGSAARAMVARQLIEWGEEGLTEHPDLDPAGLLTEALAMDPFAANLYWHLATRYMAAGAPDEAWFFLDTGRALPGRASTPTLDQADSLERRLRLLAPALFPGHAEQ
ncbi:hypothetical protein AB6B38_07930 [Glycocaulis abyssi]|uniref:Uncharacterized protein n=1 Tax=Glycocaulis abyssi TaxID=1433403 RepID=A0ABV9NBL6_9PROT